MPIINPLAATGLVSLPGMMTGQILAGVEPMEAVKYQLMIMFLIAGGTTLGAVPAVFAGLHRLTDNRDRLRLDRLAGECRAFQLLLVTLRSAARRVGKGCVGPRSSRWSQRHQ